MLYEKIDTTYIYENLFDLFQYIVYFDDRAGMIPDGHYNEDAAIRHFIKLGTDKNEAKDIVNQAKILLSKNYFPDQSIKRLKNLNHGDSRTEKEWFVDVVSKLAQHFDLDF